MAKAKATFNKYFNADKTEVLEERRALILNKVKRAFGNAEDSIKDTNLAIAEKLEKERYSFANSGDVRYLNNIADLLISLEDNKAALALVEAERKTFLTEE